MTGTLDDTLEVADRNIGFVEGPNNDNPFAAVAGHPNHQPWCASFVAAVFKRSGVPLPNYSAYTPTMAQGFKDQHRWFKIGQPGDVIFFQWPGMGRIAHVGIVEDVIRGAYVTVEGNTDVRGGRTGGRVMRHQRRTCIAGFGRPVYLPPTNTNVPPGRSPILGLVNPPLYGPKVADVHRGFITIYPRNKALLTPDLAKERWGEATNKVANSFKRNRKIDETGWGELSWAALRAEIAAKQAS